ncbi:MAG: hypothetical protein U9P14_06970, partial [Gemmatimonadota bacterium]|nr:hypothetical protein [Gemmatimonadota bacterium]
MCADDTTYFDYALVCAWPVTGDPASNINTEEGLALEAANLISTAKMAHTLVSTGFKLPRPPKSPNFTLIPGDGRVTVTWDNVSSFSRDNFYDVYQSQGVVNDYREYDFQGYRLYRSTTGRLEDAVLLAQFDLKDGVTLQSGILGRRIKVLLDDGSEKTLVSSELLDTLGISEYDHVRGIRHGLGHDTGIRFSYIDRSEEVVGTGEKGVHPLTNGFRYFYSVTAYDWNGTDRNDLTTMTSQESSLQFSVANMTIPRSDASGYRSASIPTESYEVGILGQDGGELDRSARDIVVTRGRLAGGAEVTNALQNPCITIANPNLIDGDCLYMVSIDSVLGQPDSFTNPQLNPGYDAELWNRV